MQLNKNQQKNKFNNPLVSIVTPTWQKNKQLLIKCIPSIRQQTYPYLEHIVVSDGPDVALKQSLDDLFYFDRYIQLGHNWQSATQAKHPVIATNVGAYIAKGRYITYASANEKLPKRHIEKMVKAIVENDADMVIAERHLSSKKKGDIVIAHKPSDILHKVEVLQDFPWFEDTEDLIQACIANNKKIVTV